jgi:hypothetical protein
MKTSFSFPRVAFIALALGTAGVTATFAQTTTTTTAPTCTAGGWHHHHGWDKVLTAAERTELKTDFKSALAANGTLQSQKAALKQQFETLKSEGASATPAQWQALHQQKEAFHQSVKAAVLLADPNAQAIFAKLEAAHQGHHHHDDGATTPSNT